MEFIFYLSLFLLLAYMGLLHSDVDYDFWARLIVGKTYFQTGAVLKNDFLSYTPAHPWYDHEWGSSLLFYFVQSRFGENGLFVLKIILYFLTFFIIAQIIKLRYEVRFKKNENDKFYLSFLFFFFAIQCIANTLFNHIRCQAISLVFVVLWIYVLERVRLKNENRLLWIIPTTMLIWVNTHGACSFGVGILGLYIIGEFLDKKPIKKYIITFILTALVSFINPYGIQYVIYLITASTMKRPHITEWIGTFSQLYMQQFMKFKFYVLGVFLFIGIKFIKTFFSNFTNIKDVDYIKSWWKNIDKTKLVVMATMIILTYRAARFMPFFGICAMIYCYNDVYSLFNKKLNKNVEILKDVTILILLFVNLFFYCKKYKNISSTIIYTFPAEEIEYMRQNNYMGNLVTYFHHGSYAMYKLYPNIHLYMDGRYEEIYENEVFDNLGDFIQSADSNIVDKGWKKALNKYHTDMIITEKMAPTTNALKNDPDWEILYEGTKNFILFSKKGRYKKPPKTIMDLNKIEKTKFETSIDWYKM